MKKLAMVLVMLLFITNGLVMADQLPKPTLNIKTDVQNKTFVQTTEPGSRSDLLFDQPPGPNTPYNIFSSQWDSIGGMDSRVADNFTVPYLAYIDSLVWWGGLWNFPPSDTHEIIDFAIEFFPDSTGYNQPKQSSIYSIRGPWDEVFLSDFGFWHYYRYSATITPFLADPAQTYWIVFRATLIFQPQWGWQVDTLPDLGDGQQCYFKGIHFGYPDWVPCEDVLGIPHEVPFQIYGTAYGVEESHTAVPELENISFNSITSGKIRFKIVLTSPTNVEARIFDATGRMVGTMLNSKLPAGEKVCEHNSKLPTGIYFVRVKAGKTTKTGKILVVR